jgi:transposase
MELRCKGCGSGEHTRNGFMRGKQRYRCRSCGLNFTDTPPRGKPFALKVMAVLLYVSGLSMNRTAKLVGVSTPTVQAWIEQFAKDHAPRPEPQGRAVVIELDEMWHYLKKNPRNSGSGRLGIVLRAAWLTGSAAVAIELPSSGY